MNIVFYKLADKPNKINKTLTNGLALTVNMRKTTDLNSLAMKIENNGFDISLYDYAYIQDLNRYYFMDDLTELGGGLWEFRLNIDYLKTYAAEILAANGVIMREIRNGDILETGLKRSNKPVITYEYSDKGFSDNVNSLVLVGV